MANKIKSFIKQFAALIQGDTAAVQAEKTYRKAVSAITAQIANLKGKTCDLEEAVESAEETVKLALVNNGQPLDTSNRQYYVQRLIDTDQALLAAEEALEDHKHLIKFLESKLEELEQEENAD